MKTILVCALVLTTAACGIQVRNPEKSATAEREARDAARAEASERRAQQELAELERPAGPSEHTEAYLARQRDLKAQAKTAKLESERLACEAGRSERVEQRTQYEKALEHKQELQEWQNTHCKFVSRAGAPTISASQDSRGEIHLRQVDSVAVDRKCNAPLPKDLEHIDAHDIFIRHPAYAMGCEQFDAEAQK